MNNKKYREEEIEIDVKALLFALRKKLGVIVLAGIIGFAVMFGYTRFFVTPLYNASTMMYVLPNESNGSTLTDMQVGESLTNDYASMIRSRTFIEAVIENLNLDIDYTKLSQYISVSSPSDSRILQVVVKYPDAREAMEIANEIASVAEEKLAEITSVKALTVYEKAVEPVVPSSPNLKKNCVVGALAGFVIALIIVAAMFIMDDTIKTEDDIEKYLGTTTLAVIPYLDNRYKQKKSRKKEVTRQRKERRR